MPISPNLMENVYKRGAWGARGAETRSSMYQLATSIAKGIGPEGQTPGGMLPHITASVERIFKKRMESFATPAGKVTMPFWQTLGPSITEIGIIMTRESQAGVKAPIAQVVAHAQKRWKMNEWRAITKSIALDLPAMPTSGIIKDNRAAIQGILDIAKPHGWKPQFGQYKIQGQDDIVNTLRLVRQGSKDIPIPIPVMGSKFAYQKSEQGFAGYILTDVKMPGGRERVSYLQAMASMLGERNAAHAKTGIGRFSLSEQLGQIANKISLAKVNRTYTPYEISALTSVLDMDLLGEGDLAAKFYSIHKGKGPGTGPEAAFNFLAGKTSLEGYSNALQNPEHLLAGRRSTIRRADIPFGQALGATKPTYYRYGVAPLMGRQLTALKPAPIIPVQTAFELASVNPMFKKGTVSNHWMKTLIITDPAAYQAWASGREAVVMSQAAYEAMASPTMGPPDDAMTMLMHGSRKAHFGGRVPTKLMGGYDIITAMDPQSDQLLRTAVGGGLQEALLDKKLSAYTGKLRQLGVPLRTRGGAVELGELSESLEYDKLYNKILGVHEELGLTYAAQPVKKVTSLTTGGVTRQLPPGSVAMWSQVARRGIALEDEISQAWRPFSPHVEMKYLQLQGQDDIAKFLMEKATAGQFKPFPEIQKTLLPFAGHGSMLKDIPGAVITRAEDIRADLSWFTRGQVTLGSTQKTTETVFQELWERGMTIKLPEAITLPGVKQIGGMPAHAVTEYMHIPAFKIWKKEFQMLPHAGLLSELPLSAETPVHLPKIAKTYGQLIESVERWGGGESAAQYQVQQLYRKTLEEWAELTGKGQQAPKFFERMLKPTVEASLYLRAAPSLYQAKGAGEALSYLAKSVEGRRGIVSPGIGEVLLSRADIKKAGLTLEQVRAGKGYAGMLRYPVISPSSFMPVKIREAAIQQGTMRTHAAQALEAFGDLDADDYVLFTDPTGKKAAAWEKWHQGHVKESKKNYDLFTAKVKERGGSADITEALSKVDRSTRAEIAERVYGTKLLTGMVHTKLDPYRLMSQKVLQGNIQQAKITAEALALIQQQTIQKGALGGADILKYLKTVNATASEEAVTAKLTRMLEENANAIIESGVETGKGVQPFLFGGATGTAKLNRKLAAEGMYKTHIAKLKQPNVWNFYKMFTGKGAATGADFLEMMTASGMDPSIPNIGGISSLLGSSQIGGTSGLLPINERGLISDINMAAVEAGARAAPLGLWGSAKLWYKSLPAWGKFGTVGVAAVAGLAMYRGLTVTSELGPSIRIPPEVVAKELYGSGQQGSPVSPSPLNMPAHDEYRPTVMPNMKPPARVRMDGRGFDIKLHGRDTSFMDPKGLPPELERLLHQHIGTDINTSVRVSGPTMPESRQAVMRKVGDMRESRLYNA